MSSTPVIIALRVEDRMDWLSAPFYDRIYGHKDYASEAAYVRTAIESRLLADGRRLLDVACGTGNHLVHLKETFETEGLDLSADLLRVAGEKHPKVKFHRGDMSAFDLGVTYDVVTCLFSSIGYLKTLDELAAAAACFWKHVAPGGVVAVEPWFTPTQWKPDTVHAMFIDEPELKLARINTSHRVGNLSVFDLHYLVGTPEQTEHFVEHHEMGLFETHQLQTAFQDAGFKVEYDESGPNGRGLLIGSRPRDA